jgi:transcription antitermination factor NusG
MINENVDNTQDNPIRDIYTVQVRQGSEKKIIQLIQNQIENTPFLDKVEKVFMKVQKSSYHRDGKIIDREINLYSGYIFLQADLSFDLNQMIEQVPGVIKILKAAKHPPKPRKKKPAAKNVNDKLPAARKIIKKQPETPKKPGKKTTRRRITKKKPKKIKPGIRLIPQSLTQNEANKLLGISNISFSHQKQIQFIKGDAVKIISGPFKDFDGVVNKVNNSDNKLTVNVAIFGRVTPVDLRIDEVEHP